MAAGLVIATRPQVHDLFLDVAAPWQQNKEGAAQGAVLLGLYVTIFWALPVHAVARLAVGSPWWLDSPYAKSHANCRAAVAARFGAPVIWIPRLLGLSCYLILIASALYAWIDMPIADDELLAGIVGGAILADGLSLAAFCALFMIYAVFRRPLVRALSGGKTVPQPQTRVEGEVESWDGWVDEVVSFAAVGALAFELLAPFVNDNFASATLVNTIFVRLSLLPVLLGAWTPLVGWLARFGYRWRAPLEIFALLALGVAFFALGDNHTSTTLVRKQAVRASLADAIRQWKKLNCQDQIDADTYRACPSPIVALVSGGASRSGFFAGSVLGLLTDISCERDAMQCPAPLFANRLFAISSVSGGSVGAALYARALADRTDDGGPPCDRNQGSPNYFRADNGSWRRCLQKILAEDFLSPIISGLGFRDVFGFIGSAFGPCVWPDRGHRIELAIARSYLLYKYDDHPEPGCTIERAHGLDADFISLGPDPSDKAAVAPKRWKPILLLNSTDAQTGKRFVFSGVLPGGDASGQRWLEDAYDFHESFPGEDIPIVGAAHDSARFPVISPAGALYKNCKLASTAAFLDRLEAMLQPPPCAKLVDGGYFDNYGAATARDLVEALISDGKLKPFVLLIANDPSAVDHAAFGSVNPNGKPNDLQGAVGYWFLPLIAAPVDAVVGTASARGELAIEELRRLVLTQKPGADGADPSCSARGVPAANPCFAMIGVHSPSASLDESARSIENRLDGVSMSWWLSKPVQQYLDNQLELPVGKPVSGRQRDLASDGFKKNVASINQICDVLAGGTGFAARCKKRVHMLANDPP